LPSPFSDLVIPHCTYTDPEVAQVGLTPRVAARRGIAIDIHRLELGIVERAVIDGEADGFVALYIHDALIVGTAFVAAHAGESLPLLWVEAVTARRKAMPSGIIDLLHRQGYKTAGAARA
jgi:pyruvate/2-oxoglutarate dehydrogenase complex dihydrolipoamide dehydrogenase (E3) component